MTRSDEMKEQKLLTKNPTNYGSMGRVRLFDLTDEQIRATGEQKQVYTSFPFFNDVINLAVGQMKALCNQEVLTPPATKIRLDQILNNAKQPTKDNESDSHLPPLIRALRVPELTEENSRAFVLQAEFVSFDLDLETMSDAVKHDFIFVLKCGLSVLEGVEKDKVIKCIGRFETALKKEQSAEVVSVNVAAGMIR